MRTAKALAAAQAHLNLAGRLYVKYPFHELARLFNGRTIISSKTLVSNKVLIEILHGKKTAWKGSHCFY